MRGVPYSGLKGVALVRSGTVLAGRYRLEQRIASGGMGEVWRAFDRVLGRVVAVKCLLALATEEPGVVGRFHAEARTMATISHPGVVEVYDFGEDPSTGVYLVMKYIEGESLARTLARVGRLTAEATMRLMAEAAEALHAAHERGVTHRDVKPGNLLLRPDGSALLTDFGIAGSAGVHGHTATGSLVGTAGYMAPERANGRPATARSDIYSLGVVAYRCLAGHVPFAGDSPLEVALRHVHDEPPPLPADVPPGVRAIVRRAMAKDPAQRWPSAAVLAVEARRALAPVPQRLPEPESEPDPTVRVPAGDRPIRGRRLLVAGAAVVVAAIIATVAFAFSRGSEPKPQGMQATPDASAISDALDAGAVEASASPVVTNAASNPAPTTTTRPKAGAGTEPPAAPRNLTATPVDAGTIRLRWSDASGDEDGFTVTNGVTSKDVRANATTLDWGGLAPSTRSCFKVRAFNPLGVSAYFPAAEPDWVCATSLPGSGPAAPTGLTATALSATTVRLQWTDRSGDEDGFTVINGVTSKNAGANATTLDWGGLAPGSYACFKVRAFNSSGVSAYYPTAEREWVCLTTPAS